MNPIHKIRSIISLRRRTKSSSSEELLQEITCLFVDILKEIAKHINTKQATSHRLGLINQLVKSISRSPTNPKKNGIILFIDNYERIEHFLNPWLLNILSNKSYEVLAGKVKLVIAGRRKLNSHTFPDPYTRLTFRYVGQWTKGGAEGYLKVKGITDPKHRELILELSGRLHRWLYVLASEYSSIAQNAIVSKTLIQRFLELYVEDPAQRQFILEVALARKFNFYVISELLGEEVAKDTFNLLTALPFIEQDLYGFYRFPDSIRELLLSLLRESPNSDVRRWNECHEKLARYYKLSLNFGFNYAQWSENQWIPTWQRCVQFPVMEYYVLEAIYHDLCRSYPGNTQVMLNSLCAAAQVSGQLGVRLVRTIRQAARDCRYLDDMVENINLEALKLLKEFLLDNRLTPNQRNWLSKLCGIAYFNIADYNNALQHLNCVLSA